MKEKYKWPVYGVLIGLVLSIISRFLVMKQAGLDISIRTMVGNPLSVWTRSLAPLVLGLVFFYIGVSKDRLIELKNQAEKKSKELQKKMIEQSIRLGEELNKTIDDLNEYTDQLDIIVNNIRAGVCIIDRNFTIEEGFNRALIDIFGNKDYLNSSVFNTVFMMLDKDKKKETSDFLEQCFLNETASDSILSAANPLEEFNYLYLDGSNAVSKVVKMRIVRIRNKEDHIEKLMLLFDDVTVERELEKSIKEKDAEYDKKYGIIVSLLGNDREVTKQFIDDLGYNMGILGAALKKLQQNEINDEILDEVTGIVHSIKGEAFSLDFNSLAVEASEFEKLLKEHKGRLLDLETNLEIVNYYEKLNIEHAFFKKIINELKSFLYGEDKKPKENKLNIRENIDKYTEMNSEKRSSALLEKELKTVAEKTAEEKNKSVKLDFVSQIEEFRLEVYIPLKESLIHLVRNSIDHGIEYSSERIECGKSETGQIRISLSETETGFVVAYSDDGRGIDVEKIKAEAVEKKIADKQAVENMNNLDVLKFIFKDGFSTAGKVDMVSGMGVGMSVVKKNIIGNLKGKLSISNKEGKGFLLKMNIPADKEV